MEKALTQHFDFMLGKETVTLYYCSEKTDIRLIDSNSSDLFNFHTC